MSHHDWVIDCETWCGGTPDDECQHSWHTAETPDGGASVACDLCGKVMVEEDVEEGD